MQGNLLKLSGTEVSSKKERRLDRNENRSPVRKSVKDRLGPKDRSARESDSPPRKSEKKSLSPSRKFGDERLARDKKAVRERLGNSEVLNFYFIFNKIEYSLLD